MSEPIYLADVAAAIRALRGDLDENIQLGMIIKVNQKVSEKVVNGRATFYDMILVNPETRQQYPVPVFVRTAGLVVKAVRVIDLIHPKEEQTGAHLRIAYSDNFIDDVMPEWFTEHIASLETALTTDERLTEADRIGMGNRLTYAKSVVCDSNNYAYVVSQINDALVATILDAPLIHASGSTAEPDPRWHPEFSTTMGTSMTSGSRTTWTPKATAFYEAYCRTYKMKDKITKAEVEVPFDRPALKLGLKFAPGNAPNKLAIKNKSDVTIIDLRPGTDKLKPAIRNYAPDNYPDPSMPSMLIHEITNATLNKAVTPGSIVISSSLQFKLVRSGVGWSWTPVIYNMNVYRSPRASTAVPGGGDYDDPAEELASMNIGSSSGQHDNPQETSDFD